MWCAFSFAALAKATEQAGGTTSSFVPLKSQVFPASTLGKESDINQGLTLGTVDIILTGASFAGNTYRPLAVTYFPFIFRDAEHLLKYAQSDVFF